MDVLGFNVIGLKTGAIKTAGYLDSLFIGLEIYGMLDLDLGFLRFGFPGLVFLGSAFRQDIVVDRDVKM